MCGIAGFVDLAGGPDACIAEVGLQAMVEALHHRGPDASGCWGDPNAGVFLGHTRLAIIELSPMGAQPMLTPDRDAVIVFNGEIYNFAQLRDDLHSEGVIFYGRSDTEVLLQALYRWGPAKTLPRINGMFAFAYWDSRTRQLTIARDRIGEKPLYYGLVNGHFFFASELKALRAHPAFVAQMNPDALTHFLRFSYVPGPASIYRDVHKLLPGHWVSFDLESRSHDEPKRFWDFAEMIDLSQRESVNRSPAEWQRLVHEALQRAVALRMVADRPVGCFLSGGIDSSTVAAVMQSLSNQPIRTFTIGYREIPFNESTDAERVAKHLGTDHTTFIVNSQQALDVIPQLADIYDEPYADSSQIPTALLSQVTVGHVTVALTGDGGDEVFGGYNRYVWTHDVFHWLQRIPRGLRQSMARMIQSVPPNRLDRIFAPISRVAPRLLQLRHPGDKLHKISNMAGASTDVELYRRLSSLCQNPELFDGNKGLALPFESLQLPRVALSSEERMMFWDSQTYLPDDILVKVDRAAMHVALEGRMPFLDNEVIALAWQLPLSEKIGKSVGKRIVRNVLEQYVPRTLWDRPKTGFGVPVGAWLRTSLREWAEDLLAEARLTQYLDPKPVRELWTQHLEGRSDVAPQLWNILMLSAWLRRWRM